MNQWRIAQHDTSNEKRQDRVYPGRGFLPGVFRLCVGLVLRYSNGIGDGRDGISTPCPMSGGHLL